MGDGVGDRVRWGNCKCKIVRGGWASESRPGPHCTPRPALHAQATSTRGPLVRPHPRFPTTAAGHGPPQSPTCARWRLPCGCPWRGPGRCAGLSPGHQTAASRWTRGCGGGAPEGHGGPAAAPPRRWCPHQASGCRSAAQANRGTGNTKDRTPPMREVTVRCTDWCPDAQGREEAATHRRLQSLQPCAADAQ